MGFIGTALRCFFGTIAGFLRLGPFILGELLSHKALPKYEETGAQELGAKALKNHDECEKDSFKDVYFTSKDGTRLHAVVDSGKRRKKGKCPIVMVHGFPELWISWSGQLKHFAAKGHPVLALNMRGYGLSDKPDPASLQPYHLYDSILEDIRAAVQYATKEAGEGASPPLLVAHDWGASVCWAYVTQGQTTKAGEISGYASLAIPPPECFEANMGLKQLWASLYILFFNMPWLPEVVMLANNAWLIGVMMSATKRAKVPDWMVNTYRFNCLQKGAMTCQLNYYRSLVQMAPKPNEVDILGPKKRRRWWKGASSRVASSNDTRQG